LSDGTGDGCDVGAGVGEEERCIVDSVDWQWRWQQRGQLRRLHRGHRRRRRRGLRRGRWPQVGKGVRARDGLRIGRVSEDVGCGVGTLRNRKVEKRGGGTAATAASAAAFTGTWAPVSNSKSYSNWRVGIGERQHGRRHRHQHYGWNGRWQQSRRRRGSGHGL
jgi:hypothetical protein